VDLLLDRLQDGGQSTARDVRKLPASLVIRGSTAPPTTAVVGEPAPTR
jgi:hypothetical protein